MRTGLLSRSAWFAFGTFASWAALLDMAIIMEPAPGRWNSVEGIVAGNLASLFLAPWIGIPFTAWYAIRRRVATGEVGRSWVPLLAGLSHPWLSVSLVLCLEGLIDPRHAGSAVPISIGLFTCLGHPILAAELSFRLEYLPAGTANKAVQRTRLSAGR